MDSRSGRHLSKLLSLSSCSKQHLRRLSSRTSLNPAKTLVVKLPVFSVAIWSGINLDRMVDVSPILRDSVETFLDTSVVVSLDGNAIGNNPSSDYHAQYWPKGEFLEVRPGVVDGS